MQLFFPYLVLIEEHLKLSDADSQVGLIVLIGDVPAERTKLPPLLHQGMEEAESKQQLFPLVLMTIQYKGK